MKHIMVWGYFKNFFSLKNICMCKQTFLCIILKKETSLEASYPEILLVMSNVLLA